ncbi:hypothetical protein [Azospirillum picis]|uniref:Uncharacterized protein n=1 Tax=Azospirillum picis TaxID=488438 RepID=A0ABU0MP99_9PROT|nr:hypothetical protein [Azospirillum picis]MBP2301458.1 hypothetical protein [Azospirillum picis]MDQ0535290.1 hypothetical protein [Azospirillum picis]
MTTSPPLSIRLAVPLAVPLAALLVLGACAAPDLRDETPGRAQAFPPVHTQTLIPGGERRMWSEIQAEQSRASSPSRAASRDDGRPDPAGRQEQETGQQPRKPPPRRRGSSSPPPDPAVLPQPPRPVQMPPPPSTQGTTDAFKRDLLQPDVQRLREQDALGRLDPFGQRDLMKRENDLRQYGDPLAR